METLLIISTVIFSYATLVKTNIHDDVIKELTTGVLEDVKYNQQIPTKDSEQSSMTSLASRKDVNEMKHVDVGGALKREIIHALVKILHDELEKKATVLLLKKQIMGKFTKNELTNELSKKRASNKVSQRRVVAKVTAADEHKMESDTIKPPSLWRRHEERSKQDWRNDEDKSVDQIHRKELIGPPGLWGRDVFEGNKAASDQGPPGLWGKDEARNILATQKAEKLSDELSNSHRRGRDAEKDSVNKQRSNV